MNTREWNLVKEAVARTRYELGNRQSPPGPDAWRNGYSGDNVTSDDAKSIRLYIRAAVEGNFKEMRRVGKAS
jgi:hypothetical protein